MIQIAFKNNQACWTHLLCRFATKYHRVWPPPGTTTAASTMNITCTSSLLFVAMLQQVFLFGASTYLQLDHTVVLTGNCTAVINRVWTSRDKQVKKRPNLTASSAQTGLLIPTSTASLSRHSYFLVHAIAERELMIMHCQEKQKLTCAITQPSCKARICPAIRLHHALATSPATGGVHIN